MKLFTSQSAWRVPLIREQIVGRLLKRYTAEGSSEGFRLAARIFASAPTAADRTRLLVELDDGLKMIGVRPAKGATLGAYYDRFAVVTADGHARDRRFSPVSAGTASGARLDLDRGLDGSARPSNCVSLGNRSAYHRVVETARGADAGVALRRELLSIVGELGDRDCVSPSWRSFAVRTTSRFGRRLTTWPLRRSADRRRGADRVSGHDNDVTRSRSRDCCSVVASGLASFWPRRTGSNSIARGAGRRSATGRSLSGRRSRHDGSRTLGQYKAGTTEEKLADIRRLSNDLRAAGGNRRRVTSCSRSTARRVTCSLAKEQNSARNLTTANRKDREFLLVSVVDPSVQVRKEYLVYAIETHDGRVITGCIAEQDPSSITLVGTKNDRTKVRRNEIAEMKEMSNSLMPERLLEPLTPQEVRDLFAYLQQ